MNRIYRKVWNNALGQVVVASEMAKGRKKASKSVGAACLTAVVLSGLAFNAFALNPNGTAPLIINDMAFGVNDSGVCQAIGGDSSNTFSTVTCNSSSQTAGLYNNALQTSSVVVATNSLSVGGYQLINGADSSNNALNITAAGAKILLNNGKVTGMAAGTVSGSSSDAINGAQLFNSNQAIATAFGTSVNAGGNVSAPSYALANANAISGGTGAATDVATGFAKVDSALGKLDTRVTTNTTNISTLQTTVNNISAGTVGLVQQAAAGANLTVGTSTDGVAVDFADKNGKTRTLKNVTAGVSATEAVNMSQLNTTNANVATNTANIATNTANLSSLGSATASSLGGSAAYSSTTGTLSAPSYTVQGSTYNNVGSALGGLDTSVTNNTNSISSLNNQINSGTTGLLQQAGAGADLTVGKDTDGAAVNFADKNGNARTLSNVTAGVNDTDAANVSQLNTTNTNVATNGTNIAANTASIATNASNIATHAANLGNLGTTAAVALGGSTIYTPATGLSGTSFGLTNANAIAGTTGAATDVTSGFSKVDSALGALNTTVTNNTTAIAGNTSSISNITNQINSGTVGLVQQAAAGAELTVGNATDGSAVNFADKNGNTRALSNVTAGVNDTDAVNMSQLNTTNAKVSTNATNIAANTASIATNASNIATHAANLGNLGTTAAAALGGGTTYDATTGLSGTSYAVQGGTYTNVGSALGGLDTAVTNNTMAIAGNSSSISNITNQINSGTVGLVQQAGAGANLTVGKDTDGMVVDVTGTAGKRKITGVADGDISDSSSDAVNGSQLYATNQQVAINTSSISNIQSTISNISNGSSGAFQMSRDRSGAMPVSSGTNSAAGGANATASGANSVAVGNDSTTSGNNATALGQGATASGAGSTAVGQGAKASNPNDVALGSGSVTSAAVAVNSATVNGVTYSNFAGSRPIGAVSVGSAGNDRQIQNVAAGQITATSTDAVNGSQLYSVASQMTNMAGQVSGVTNQVDTNTTNVTNLQNGSAGMFQVSSDANSTQPVASGTQSTAGGNGAVASGASSTAVGNNAQATGNNSVAIGAGSVATQANTVSVGSAGNERQIKNVAAGTQATDAVNVSQLQSSQAGTVHYDANTDGSVDTGSVTLNSGGSSASIHNVSAGTAVTDAVNVGQMNNGLRQVADWSKSYSDTIGHQASAGVASAMAMAGVPVAYAPNQSSVGVGVGSFRGESSLAVGMSTISESGRYVFKASATSDTRGDRGVSLGAGITF